MLTNELETLKYPIGTFEQPDVITQETIDAWIKTIERFGQNLTQVADGLTELELNYHYRPDGWSVRQVFHHIADSHMNAFIRFKLALTEDTPSIMPYKQDLWSLLPDADNDEIDDSVMLIAGLHNRWAKLLTSMSKADFERQYYHPEYDRKSPLKVILGEYAWHCNHHLAQIKQALMFHGAY